MRCERAAEFDRVREGDAVKFAGWIDACIILGGSKASDTIKVFKSKPNWIGKLMTTRA